MTTRTQITAACTLVGFSIGVFSVLITMAVAA